VKSDRWRIPAYRLRLGPEEEWTLLAGGRARPLLEKLASILELERSGAGGRPRLIFVDSDSVKKDPHAPLERLEPWIREGLPESGWTARKRCLIRMWSHRDVDDVIFTVGAEKNHDMDLIRIWTSIHAVYRRAQSSGGLPFHAALAELDGNGVLIAARGGTGKSTCCRHLPPPWRALCDDESLVVGDGRGGYLAHPFPTWSLLQSCPGGSWNVERQVPLGAIFFLEQGECDSVSPIGRGRAAIQICQSASQVFRRTWVQLNPGEQVELHRGIFENACRIAGSVPTFTLRASLGGRFWEEMERVLQFTGTR